MRQSLETNITKHAPGYMKEDSCTILIQKFGFNREENLSSSESFFLTYCAAKLHKVKHSSKYQIYSINWDAVVVSLILYSTSSLMFEMLTLTVNNFGLYFSCLQV